jgi:hypothetical protein
MWQSGSETLLLTKHSQNKIHIDHHSERPANLIPSVLWFDSTLRIHIAY